MEVTKQASTQVGFRLNAILQANRCSDDLQFIRCGKAWGGSRQWWVSEPTVQTAIERPRLWKSSLMLSEYTSSALHQQSLTRLEMSNLPTQCASPMESSFTREHSNGQLTHFQVWTWLLAISHMDRGSQGVIPCISPIWLHAKASRLDLET